MPPHLLTRDSLDTFLREWQRLRGAGGKIYFKAHDELDQWFLLASADSTLVTAYTTREAALYYLLAYPLANVKVDDENWQYWEFELDDLGAVEPLPNVLNTMSIIDMIERNSTVTTKKK